MGIVTRKQIEDAVQKWVVLATGLPGPSVIIASQNNPRPNTRPYCAIDVLSRLPIGHDEHLPPEVPDPTGAPDVYDLPIEGQREVTMQITAYGIGEVNSVEVGPMDLLAMVESSRSQAAGRAILDSGGLKYRRDIGIIPISELVNDTVSEETASIDVVFGLVDVVSDGSGIIENVAYESTLTGKTDRIENEVIET